MCCRTKALIPFKWSNNQFDPYKGSVGYDGNRTRIVGCLRESVVCTMDGGGGCFAVCICSRQTLPPPCHDPPRRHSFLTAGVRRQVGASATGGLICGGVGTLRESVEDCRGSTGKRWGALGFDSGTLQNTQQFPPHSTYPLFHPSASALDDWLTSAAPNNLLYQVTHSHFTTFSSPLP